MPTELPDEIEFRDLTLEQVKELLPDLPDAILNEPFINGDHFQKGKAWVGPGPKESDSGYRDFLEILEPAFVSKNVMDEGVDRLSSAILGWEPRWSWVPRRHDLDINPVTPEETAAIRELEEEMTAWWDRRQVHKLMRNLIYKMLWGQECVYRLYVPFGLTNNGVVQASNVREAFSKIFLDIPEPTMGTVWEHPDTKQRLGIVVYEDLEGTERAELCYLNEAGETVIRVLPEVPGETAEGSLKLGGYLTIYRVALDQPLATEQVRSLQKMLNMTLTLLGKGLVDNHFLERLFFNALPPGKWEYEADGKTRKAFVVEARKTGGRTDSYIQGIDYEKEPGKTELTTPSAVIRNPLDPQGTIGGANFWYQAMLEEMRQDHILINQLATPSGRGREQARGDFIDSTKDPQLQAELAGRELLWTVAYMVEEFTRQPGKWTTKFKPVFKCRPNYGPLSVNERKQNVEEADKNAMSWQTAISLNGTDDVEAELALIEAQPSKQLALSAKRAEVADKWALVFPREVALHLAGFTDTEITEIMKRVNKAQSADPNEVIKDDNETGTGGGGNAQA